MDRPKQQKSMPWENIHAGVGYVTVEYGGRGQGWGRRGSHQQHMQLKPKESIGIKTTIR